MNTISVSDHEYDILDSLYRQSEGSPIRQRDLAKVLGISLGMTNVILKRLAQKGWVAIRRINSRNMRYVVTPSGIEEIVRRSFKLLKRTVRNVVYYKQIIENFLSEVRRKGYGGITLVGKSDFDFILQHICHTQNLEFRTSESPECAMENSLLVYGEDYTSTSRCGQAVKERNGEYLQEILIGL